MADQLSVQYVGFTAGVLVREYSFVVRDETGRPRDYTVSIANEAFVSNRVRYQDGPVYLFAETPSRARRQPDGSLYDKVFHNGFGISRLQR